MNTFNKFLLILIVFVLQGCVAAAPLLSVGSLAFGGFSLFKGIQLSTGGSGEIRFKDAQISNEDLKLISSIKHLGVWPGSSKSIKIAELLSSNENYKITTPNKIQTISEKLKQTVRLEQLTEDEKKQVFKKIADASKVEGMLIYSEGGVGTEIKYWSFKRSETIIDITIEIFSPVQDRIIWKQEGQAVLKIGAKYPPQDEIDQFIASACVEKLLSISQVK